MDACAFDIKESYELDLQIKEFESGQFKGVAGPSMAKHSRKRSIEKQLQARRYAEQIFIFTAPSSKSSTSATILVDPSDTHRAEKKNPKCGKPNSDLNSEEGKGSCNKRETKYRSKRSQTIVKRINSAKKEQNQIKIKSFKDTYSGR